MNKPEQMKQTKRRNDRIPYSPGDEVGPYGFVFVRDAEPKYSNHRRAVLRCVCGCEKEHDLSAVRTGGIKSCGCWKRIPQNASNFQHGWSKTKAYDTWCGIKKRCYNEKSTRYRYYGGRGIRMCDEWLNNSGAFCEYVSSLEHYDEIGYSLDRIDNDRDYEPGNLRWATQTVQVRNSGQRSNNHSGYRGVHRIKATGACGKAYMSYIRAFRKHTYLGVFDTAEEAVGARNNYIIQHGLWEYQIQAAPDYLIY